MRIRHWLDKWAARFFYQRRRLKNSNRHWRRRHTPLSAEGLEPRHLLSGVSFVTDDLESDSALVAQATPTPADSVVEVASIDSASVVVTNDTTSATADVAAAYPGKTAGEYRNAGAFAAVREDGSVVCWGNDRYGGDSSSVADQLAGGVREVFSNRYAFAAVRDDGSVVSWGHPQLGGNLGDAADALAGGVKRIYSTFSAFAAVKNDGSVVTWGNANAGGDSSAVADQLAGGVVKIYSNRSAFAALKQDGSVVTWGMAASGGDSSGVAAELENVQEISATAFAFAALKQDGSVVAWGHADRGGVPSADLGPVARLFANQYAFAALGTDGTLTTWGHPDFGGAVSESLGEIVEVVASDRAFAARMTDGSVRCWGAADFGGSGPGDLVAVDQLFATKRAFAALMADGSVRTWGHSFFGGASDQVATDLSGGVTAIVANDLAFAAMRDDGSVVTWGSAMHGGESDGAGLGEGVAHLHASGGAFAAVMNDGSVRSWGRAASGGDSSGVSDQLAGGVTGLADPTTEVLDTMPPVITLLGDAETRIEASPTEDYVDAGATATDLIDGNLNHAVVVSGDVVDMRVPGTYIIEYNCEDLSGNEADEVTRQVVVEDTTCPVVQLSGSEHVEIEAGFPYEDAGATAEDSLDGDLTDEIETTVTYTDENGDEIEIEEVETQYPRLYKVRYDVEDAAGNVADTVIRTVTVQDTLPPVITLSASNAAGDIATLVAEFYTWFAEALPDGAVAEASDVTLNLLGLFEGIDASAAVESVALYDDSDADGNLGSDGVIDGFSLVGGRVRVDEQFELKAGETTLLDAAGLTLTLDELTYRPNLNESVSLGTLGLFIDTGALLPDQSGDGFGATLQYVGGEVDLDTGAATLSALGSEIRFGTAVVVNGVGGTLTIDPNNEATDAELFSLQQGSVRFPDYPDLPTVDLSGLTVRRDGVTLDNFEADFSAGPDDPVTSEAVSASLQSFGADAAMATSDFAVANAVTPERPLLVVPGIVGTFPRANDAWDHELFDPSTWNQIEYKEMLLNRGVHPDKMEPEKLTGVYDDLVASLQTVGYRLGTDLFTVNYDWRVLPGPIDGEIDGIISGVEAEALVDARFDYGVDYMGYYLDLASDIWAAAHNGIRPLSVDVIAHSTGGLVTRSYIQSTAYGKDYVDGENKQYEKKPIAVTSPETHTLPKINHFVSVGVPHRGASKAWGMLHNDFSGDLAFQFVLSKILNAAYQKVLAGGVVEGPSRNVDGDDAIRLSDILVNGVPSPELFIEQYVPTGRALLATYPFLKDTHDEWVDINTDPNQGNTLALDLNAGADLPSGTEGDANAFIEKLKAEGRFTVVAGVGESTPTFNREQVGDANASFWNFLEWPSSIDSFIGSMPQEGDTWYQTEVLPYGDGTVPLRSAAGQFLGEAGDKTDIYLFFEDAAPPNSDAYEAIETEEAPAHTALMHLKETQQIILKAIGHDVEKDILSTNLNRKHLGNIVASIIVDPVEAMLYKGTGDDAEELVGFDVNDGPQMSEGTYYLGGADGIGFVFDSALAPGEALSLDLTPIDGGGPYDVLVSQMNGGIGGGHFEGALEAGQELLAAINFERIFDFRFGVADLLEVDGLTIGGNNLELTFGDDGLDFVGTLTIAADGAALLPDTSTEALDGVATVTDFSGSLDVGTGALSLTAATAEVTVEGIVTASAVGEAASAVGEDDIPGISLTIDPAVTDPEAPLASLNNLTLTLPALSDLAPIEIDALTVLRNGFDLAVDREDLTIDLPGLLKVDNVETTDNLDLAIDLQARFFESESGDSQLPQLVLGGSVELTAGGAQLLPGQPLSLDVVSVEGDARPAFTAALDLDARSFKMDLLKLDGGLQLDGESIFSFTADPTTADPALSFTFNPNLADNDELFSLGTLVGTFDALAIDSGAPTVRLEATADAPGFRVQRDGDIALGAVTLALPEDYLNKSLGLGGLLPVEIETLEATFAADSEGNTDFSSLALTAQMQVDTAGLEEKLGEVAFRARTDGRAETGDHGPKIRRVRLAE